MIRPLHAVVASTTALVVAASAGVALASAPAPTELAVPAQDPVALAPAQHEERVALLTSRAAQREADRAVQQQQLSSAAEQRALALSATSQAIDATETVLQEERAAKAAAEKAAAEAARPKGGTRAQNKELARHLAQELYGWGAEQFTCYDNIIMRESLWDQHADNPTSSAYGIPQALPGKKMASEGADWMTNPETQIRWGLKYVKQRFGTPCKAWSFKRANGWY
ncbi:MAG: hypothetical protein Q4F65_04280 [Propionibacteriaceae bacterium]|nr:hypothetical protein [Propionibacteriaceae bacterium]